MRTAISIVAMLSGVLAPAVHAQNAGNNLGKQIANNGAPNGVTACASCHGANGEGNASANFPRIAGQSQAYLAKQLASYANGSRKNQVMQPIAKALSQQQIDAVSAYYASLSPPASGPASGPASAQAAPDAQKRGQTLATVGDEKLGVQGCANCHGPGGSGEPPAYPYLASQHAGYLKAALGEWKSGARNTDPSMQMHMIAKRLSDNDIAALASYYAAQPAPPAHHANVPTTASGTSGQSDTPSHAGTSPVQGVGSGQGAATSGGSQGPGGSDAASGSHPSGTPKDNAR